MDSTITTSTKECYNFTVVIFHVRFIYRIGSQFFITLGQDLDSLDEHIIFGEVTEGREVLLKLNETICDHENHPYQDIR